MVSRAPLNGTELKALLSAITPQPGSQSSTIPASFKADYGLQIVTAHGKFDLLMSSVSLGMVHYGLDQKSYRYETVGPKCRTTLTGLRKRKALKAPTT